jgi:quercetin dioxygenase-like cupin family protein
MTGVHVSSIGQGLLFDHFDERFPTRVYTWNDKSGPLALENRTSSYFGYVFRGHAKLSDTDTSYTLKQGHYFCFNQYMAIEGGSGMLIERGHYRALNQLGGPVESEGRLKYIDGCTDTLLVPPVKRGDACLNALFFPSGVNQTLHTHPSIRVGMVAEGAGECRTASGVLPLALGNVFVIEEDAVHGFHTEADNAMLVIAYHPDTDFGPIDMDHPMINRTIVHGISASQISEIHTR